MTDKPPAISSGDVHREDVIEAQFFNTLKGFSGSLEQQQTIQAKLERLSINEQLLLQLYQSQLNSRIMDIAARRLRGENKVFYTIASSGHEANAVIGKLCRITDPAYLHYRSGALMAQRASKVKGIDFIHDTALSLCCSAEDPASGGRHKVWGHPELGVIPQTSTIASHLPKAMGAAIALSQAHLFKHKLEIPDDSVVLCSFGDASLNHSTAQGAINTVQWAHYQGLNVPLVFLCEDNDWGISTPSPRGWVAERLQQSCEIRYFYANGLDLLDAYGQCRQAIDYCRTHRAPVFIHLKTIRLMGHAGSDVELQYRDLQQLQKSEAQDPLLHSARLIISAGLQSADQLIEQYRALYQQALEAIKLAAKTRKLNSAEAITEPLAPLHLDALLEQAQSKVDSALSNPATNTSGAHPPQALAGMINQALFELMQTYPQSLVFGEDVAQKGGVYSLTKGLMQRYSHHRVFNTLLDEQSILGLAQGYASLGFLPIAEIQYLAFVHNALDQLRSEAASLQFFSNLQFSNPLLLRLPGLGYQKGFGGHFHNDNSIAALRDIPGLVIACPSRGDDAVKMLRTLMALLKVDGRVCVFLEPIALYHQKDLYRKGDKCWMFDYPASGEVIEPGQGRVYHAEADDLLIISYANGLHLSLQAARRLEQLCDKKVRVLDLRWLNPLNHQQVLQHSEQCQRVLVVDECRESGALGHEIVSLLAQHQYKKPVSLLTAVDVYTPLGEAAQWVLPGVDAIVKKAQSLINEGFTACHRR